MDNRTVRFETIDAETHQPIDIKIIKMSDIGRCPSVIFLPSHYRADGTCRHDEPICEEEGCTNLKSQPEIYCSEHLEVYGV